METPSDITMPPAGENLYDTLQAQALEWVQQMSGKIWTDYNPHDPGVTTLDIVNYALTEMDYRMNFPLEDYLAGPRQLFYSTSYGLFGPSEVFAMQPVTPEDYRHLVMDNLEEVEDVQLKIHRPVYGEECLGWYDIQVELSPYIEADRLEATKEKVYRAICRLYHSHRNLGENLYGVRFVERHKLTLTGDIEIDGSISPEDLLVAIYTEAQALFAPGTHLDNGSIPVYALYKAVKQLPGIRVIRSLDFPETDRQEGPYTLAATEPKDLKVRLFSNGKAVQANLGQVLRRLHARTNIRHVIRNKKKKEPADPVLPARLHRMSHYSIQNDFPACYGTHIKEQALHATEKRRVELRQFKAYLLLFDLFLAKGLEEINRLPEWMALTSNVAPDDDPELDAPELLWELFVDQHLIKYNRPETRGKRETNKHRLLDMLEKIYGENSNPPYLRLKDSTQNIERRVNFIRRLPGLIRDRYTGVDLLDATSRSGLEDYLTCLLGLDKEGLQVYVIEHLLLYPDTGAERTFIPTDAEIVEQTGTVQDELPLECTLSIIFPESALFTAHPEYRIPLEQRLRQRIPAHLTFDVYWLPRAPFDSFRKYYADWRKARAEGDISWAGRLAGMLANGLVDLKKRTQKK